VKRWLKRILVVVVVGLLAFVFGFLPYFLAGLFTVRTFQMTDKENQGLTPASFDLPFDEVSFAARDGVTLSGWWVPAPEGKGTVVLVHGLNRSRIEMVKKVPLLHRLGWNALLFDLRRHGKSEGKLRSLGFHERNDVLGAVDFARQRVPAPVVAWGISFGAAASTLALAEEPRIDALICDSSYRSLRDTARHHLRLFRRFAWFLRLVPSWPTADEAVFWMGWRAGFDPDALDVLAAAKRLQGRPALFVAASGDPRMPPEIAFDLKAAAGPQARVLVIPSQGHGHAYRDGTAPYERAVGEVLGEVLERSRGHE
jgi:pimeloyl-ACP methyl ester carboxylesterase